MANTLITSSMVAKESLRLLENHLVFARGVNRKYEKEFEGDRKIGDTITVKLPSRYTVRKGQTAIIQNNTQQSTQITLNEQAGVDVEFSSKELALSLDDFSTNVLQPQIAELANQIDYEGLSLYKQIYNAVGTPGTIPSAMKTYAQAGAKMSNEAAPLENRFAVLDAMSEVELIDSQKGLFNSSREIDGQYENGRMGRAAGLDFSMSQNIATHTVGAWAGAGAVNGAGQSGSSLITDGWTGVSALKQGDVFTIAGVFAVNPKTRQSTGQLRQFVVQADVANAGGAKTISIAPAIVASGALQTVTALPADNALLTVMGTAGTASPTNIVYHKDAFALVTVDLPLPKGMDMASRASSKQVGLSIRFVRGYDVMNDKFVSRLDVLYGWKCIRPELACRVQS